jgi:hypothetical protein
VVPLGQKSLKRLEPNWKILVKRSDGDIARRAEIRKIDVAAIAEIEKRWSVQEKEIRR